MTTNRRRTALLGATLATACSGDIRITGGTEGSTAELPSTSSTTAEPATGDAPTTSSSPATGGDTGTGTTTDVVTTDGTTGAATTDATSEPAATGTGDPDTSSGTTGEPDLPPGCDADSLFIYLLDVDGVLHRFEPETLERTELGKLGCPADPPFPMAMTIDRTGDAWMYYADRKVYRVDTETLACEATPHVPPANEEFVGFGLSFSANAIDSPDDTLYFSGLAGPIDPSTPAGLGRALGDELTFDLVGTIDDLKGTPAGIADLTGTGDARLYAFFASEPAVISEIDKQTGQRIDPWTLDGFGTGSPWAFAFYAGEFWLFTSTGDLGNSAVTTFDPETKTLTPRIDDLGLKIVGAGVSTCVPVLPQ